jgi:hypothetical protein
MDRWMETDRETDRPSDKQSRACSGFDNNFPVKEGKQVIKRNIKGDINKICERVGYIRLKKLSRNKEPNEKKVCCFQEFRRNFWVYTLCQF